MKSSIITREYSPSDYRDIVNAGYPFNLTDLKSQCGWKGWILRIVYFLLRLDRKMFIAYSKEDRKTVGVVTLTKINDSIWGVWNAFVSTSYRRRGISTQLYLKCFEYLRNHGVKKAVGSVAIDNIASKGGLEKTWDRFISQTFCHYSGNIHLPPSTKTVGIIIRNFYPRDRETLSEIFRKCAMEDWNTSLEITKKNFLDRFIGNIYGRGLSRLLFEKRVLIAEHNKRIVAYAIVTRKRFLQKTSDNATLFLFLPPRLAMENGVSFIKKILSDLIKKGVKTISVYSHAHDKDVTERILTALNMTPTTLMVPIIEFVNIPNIDDVQSKWLKKY